MTTTTPYWVALLRGLGYTVSYAILVFIGNHIGVVPGLSATISAAIVGLVIAPLEHYLTEQDPSLGSITGQ